MSETARSVRDELEREEPREHASDVPVDERRADAKGDGGDRSSRIATHTGELHERLDGLRKPPPLDDDLRGGVKGASAAIVSQTRPAPEHLLLARGGQGIDRGEVGLESFEESNDRVHARLLQHDLAHPDAVGGRMLAPGQGALVMFVPASQTRSYASKIVE